MRRPAVAPSTPKMGCEDGTKKRRPANRDRRLEITPNLGVQSQPAGNVPQHTPDVKPLDALAGQEAELQQCVQRTSIGMRQLKLSHADQSSS
jgi:hypothetical protein